MQLVARKGAAHVFTKVIGRDAWHRFQRAAAFAAIRMAREGGCPPAPARQIVRIGSVALQGGHDLPTYALERLGVEARLAQGEVQQIEGFLAVLVERAQRAVEIITRRLETKVDGVALEPLVVGLAVEIAGA